MRKGLTTLSIIAAVIGATALTASAAMAATPSKALVAASPRAVAQTGTFTASISDGSITCDVTADYDGGPPPAPVTIEQSTASITGSDPLCSLLTLTNSPNVSFAGSGSPETATFDEIDVTLSIPGCEYAVMGAMTTSTTGVDGPYSTIMPQMVAPSEGSDPSCTTVSISLSDGIFAPDGV